MKANVEAYQSGEELGYDEGFYGVKHKTVFKFPDNWTEAEKENYIKGYETGYESGFESASKQFNP